MGYSPRGHKVDTTKRLTLSLWPPKQRSHISASPAANVVTWLVLVSGL